jgi:hypothetical protein
MKPRSFDTWSDFNRVQGMHRFGAMKPFSAHSCYSKKIFFVLPIYIFFFLKKKNSPSQVDQTTSKRNPFELNGGNAIGGGWMGETPTNKQTKKAKKTK